jgi:hypothetical protein
MTTGGMLARFEQLMEQAVEGGLRRVFLAQLQPVQLAKAAARAMEQSQVIGVHGPVVPNHYELRVAPADLQRFADYNHTLADDVRTYLDEYALDRGLLPVARLQVELMGDAAQRAGGVSARAHFVNLAPATQRHIEQAIEGTRKLRLADLAGARPARKRSARKLSLVDDDGLRFKLETPAGIVRLGRAPDNDVTLASQRVSRYHAQLRWVESSWLAYDLDSTNGSYVDDQRITGSQPMALEAGARLRLGDHALRVEANEPRRGSA